MRYTKRVLLTSFELVAYGVLLLLLPSVVADLFFDSTLTEILVQVMLVAIAGTGILTTIAVHEGWYLEHLSGWALSRDRVDPRLVAPPPSESGSDGGEVG